MCQGIDTPIGNRAHSREALASIVLAAISSERFINEMTEFASWDADNQTSLRTLGILLAEAEKSHATIELKYQLAKFTLTGQSFDRGASPYQDFALLVGLRNMLVHSRPLEARLERNSSGELLWTAPRLMQRLHSAGVIRVDDTLKAAVERHNASRLISDAFHQVSTQPVALWACRAVSAIVINLLDSFPSNSAFAVTSEIAYRKSFQIG